ncbi:hypothetical protein LEP1GSC034_2514 [Leptospira interrogans str. 2003000735]|uniref:Uncharacterized protein n=2 Tax=Leptospiraceae TaxID=170 RepID=M6ZQT1_LEPIR|nr:hypothetical protein LEP1GSC025_2878 [Leptospira interrogans str. 2002000621]EKQ48247.1 hypothetical protein LEP1GSC026_3724 [Leptospira interrogans str. 2002000623]EMJ72529.1 hypothetical protein LEP1GSC034_2514 [Leptospira interrogans str. 2003000735]EMJ73055.1 hypothetical protein LEP1GSC033_1255 [Leptospira interrogans str. 2002000632]EMP08431.1 hypothetical protein LEP1GSC124_2298 [Leptospira interrogans serovar Pyrogenes str. 200701872]
MDWILHENAPMKKFILKVRIKKKSKNFGIKKSDLSVRCKKVNSKDVIFPVLNKKVKGHLSFLDVSHPEK